MTLIPPKIAELWETYASAVGGVGEARFYEAFYFGDNAEMVDSLAALVLAGIKKATAGSVWSYELEGKRLPVPGDMSVVTDWSGKPLCVIETTHVDIMPFDEVTEEFAAAEGEGDGSLEYWREGHRNFFMRECAQHGRTFSEKMPVSCERFKVVFQEIKCPI